LTTGITDEGTTIKLSALLYVVVIELSVTDSDVFPLSDRANLNMFDVRYQLRLNDLYDFSSTSIVHYEMTMRHLDFLDHILVGEKPMRFNHLSNIFKFALSDKGNRLTTEITDEGTTRKLSALLYVVVIELSVTDSEASVVILVISSAVTRYQC
jgi:predicted transcriptional regulator